MTQFDPSETVEAQLATQAEAATWLGAIAALQNPMASKVRKDTAHMMLAVDVLGDLTRYVRIASPERPDVLPADDQALLDKVRFARSSVRATDADRDACGAFGSWRYSILLAETLGAQRLRRVMHAIRTLRRIGEEHPAHVVDAHRLASFAQAEWGLGRLPSEARQDDHLAAWLAQDLVALPSHLRDPERHGWSVPTSSAAPRERRGGEPKALSAVAIPSRSWHDVD
jgi:hypothetical protein